MNITEYMNNNDEDFPNRVDPNSPEGDPTGSSEGSPLIDMTPTPPSGGSSRAEQEEVDPREVRRAQSAERQAYQRLGLGSLPHPEAVAGRRVEPPSPPSGGLITPDNPVGAPPASWQTEQARQAQEPRQEGAIRQDVIQAAKQKRDREKQSVMMENLVEVLDDDYDNFLQALDESNGVLETALKKINREDLVSQLDELGSKKDKDDDGSRERENLLQPSETAPVGEMGVIAVRRRTGGIKYIEYPTNEVKLMAWAKERMIGEEELDTDEEDASVEEQKYELRTLISKLSIGKETSDTVKKLNAEMQAASRQHHSYIDIRNQQDASGTSIYNRLGKITNKDQTLFMNMPGFMAVTRALDAHADEYLGASDKDQLEEFYKRVTLPAATKVIKRVLGKNEKGESVLDDDEIGFYARSVQIRAIKDWEIKRAAARGTLINSVTHERITEAELNDNNPDVIRFVDDNGVRTNDPTGDAAWLGGNRYSAFEILRRAWLPKEGAAERVDSWNLRSIDVIDGMRGGQIGGDYYSKYASLLRSRFQNFVLTELKSSGRFAELENQPGFKRLGPEAQRELRKEAANNESKEAKRITGKLLDQVLGPEVYVNEANKVRDIQNYKLSIHDWDDQSRARFFDALGSMDERKKKELFDSMFDLNNLNRGQNILTEGWGRTNIHNAHQRREALYSIEATSLAKEPSKETAMNAINKAAWEHKQIVAIGISAGAFLSSDRYQEITGKSKWSFEDNKSFWNDLANLKEHKGYLPIDMKKISEYAKRSWLGQKVTQNEQDPNKKKEFKLPSWKEFVAEYKSHEKTATTLGALWAFFWAFSRSLTKSMWEFTKKEMK